MAISIVLDAGHGGYDNGATYGERAEKDDTLRLTMAVGALLEKQGYHVIYTRTTDVYQTPYEKAQIANNADADYFISFHRNSGPMPNAYNGVQSLVYSLDDEAAVRIGDDVDEKLAQLGFQNLGLEVRPGLVVLRRTKMPAVLVEVGFLNSDSDNKIFDERFEEVAEAIASGIEEAIPNEKHDYAVQVGLFKYESNAEYQKDLVEDAGFTAGITFRDPYYVVTVDSGPDLEEAAALQDRLRRLGFDTLLITKKQAG